MLPHLRRRPITMERFHRGIGAPGFFQKDVVERISGVARARRSAEAWRHRPSSDRERHSLAALAGKPEQHHDSRLAVAHAELIQP